VTAIAVDSVDGVRDRVRDAAARGIALRIAGRGTWLDAGRPVRTTETISTRELSGITEYVPGDLTLTARAGTTLSEIRDATSAHKQWLALDPHGSDDGSIGATIATGSSGPVATSFGTPRDLVLGLEFVSGAGAIARGGGRVVKNVAGFDLTRLVTGSWGSLGVITEVTLRLHARPEADVSLAIGLRAGDSDELTHLRSLLRRLPFTPYACEVVSGPLATQLGVGGAATILARLGGNGESVTAQRSALAELGGGGGGRAAREIGPDIWARLRAVEPLDAMVFRLSRLPSEIGETWAEASRIAAECEGAAEGLSTMIHASPSRGIVRCIVPRTEHTEAALAHAFAAPSTSTRVGERLPPTLWNACGASPISDAISARIKTTFDPHRVLNPGIFGELA
jgi:glycolate oxidase FAD binding subunit